VTNPKDDERLSDLDAGLLAESLQAQWPAEGRQDAMRARILNGIKGEDAAYPATAPSAQSLLTVRTQERKWQQVARGVELCVLHEDEHKRSILLRMQAASFLLPHRHEMSEESIILEGDAIIGDDLHLNAGDFHYSPPGTLHPLLQSPSGCIVYVHGEKSFHPRPTLGLIKRLLRGSGTHKEE